MYARVSAKRAKLLDRNDYDELLKMQPNQIAKRLEEGEYRDEIDQLGTRYEGVELVELALNQNLSNTMQHLTSIAPKTLQRVMTTYLRRYDIMTLKRLLRWKKGNEKNSIRDLLVPVSGYSIEELEELGEKTFEEIVGSIQFDSDVDYQEHLEGAETLPEIEQALDKAYYRELRHLAKQVRSTPFSQFIQDELEHENLRTALRLKKYDFDRSEIENNMVNGPATGLVNDVIDANSLEEAIKAVNDSGRVENRQERLEDLEHELENQRLRSATRMLHTKPLSETSILGYLIAKVIEVRNLRMLIRAKETQIQNPETIRKNLVIA
jgi:V/A-type H+-transporting ATPase subunit C